MDQTLGIGVLQSMWKLILWPMLEIIVGDSWLLGLWSWSAWFAAWLWFVIETLTMWPEACRFCLSIDLSYESLAWKGFYYSLWYASCHCHWIISLSSSDDHGLIALIVKVLILVHSRFVNWFKDHGAFKSIDSSFMHHWLEVHSFIHGAFMVHSIKLYGPFV